MNELHGFTVQEKDNLANCVTSRCPTLKITLDLTDLSQNLQHLQLEACVQTMRASLISKCVYIQ